MVKNSKFLAKQKINSSIIRILFLCPTLPHPKILSHHYESSVKESSIANAESAWKNNAARGKTPKIQFLVQIWFVHKFFQIPAVSHNFVFMKNALMQKKKKSWKSSDICKKISKKQTILKDHTLDHIAI